MSVAQEHGTCELCRQVLPLISGRCFNCLEKQLPAIERVEPEPLPPFPLDVLPDPLANYAQTLAQAGAFPLPFVAASMFPVMATALGSRRTVMVNRASDWREPSILWVALVGESGEAKSPAMEAVLAPLFGIDEEAHHIYEVEREAWLGLSDGERKKIGIRAPRLRPWVRTDITIEQLSNDLVVNKSILAFYDELTEWIRGLQGRKYGNDASAHRAKWLQLWGGRRLDRARVGSNNESVEVFVRNPRVSLLGGIQPPLLHEISAWKDGMQFRILMAYADGSERRKRKGYIEDVAAWDTTVRWATRLEERMVPLRPEGLVLLDDFRDEMRGTGLPRALIQKAISHTARFANVLSHMWMKFEGEERDIHALDTDRACAVTRWFNAHYQHLQGELEVPEDVERVTRLSLDRLCDYLRRKALAHPQQIIFWRTALQAKLPSICTTESLEKHLKTLEARGNAKEIKWDGKRAIQWEGDR